MTDDDASTNGIPFGWQQSDPEWVDRCRAVVGTLPPDAAFSHVTAARLRGWPLSYAMAADERVHVVRRLGSAQVRSAGVVSHRAFHPRRFSRVHGLPVVAAADAWADLGELVGRGLPVGLDDLVMAGDAAANQLRGTGPMAAAVERRVRPRGKRTLVEALSFVRVGAASPRETHARLMLTRAGLPQPRLNVVVRASWDPTRVLGVADLLWEHVAADGTLRRVVGEYQGAEFHSAPWQRRRDARRRGGLEGDGWVVEEIWNRDVADDAAVRATVLRFAAALGVEESRVTPNAGLPRFFSTHAMELAVQRDSRRR